jgi:F0F1-type ATP synthase beta subunit
MSYFLLIIYFVIHNSEVSALLGRIPFVVDYQLNLATNIEI